MANKKAPVAKEAERVLFTKEMKKTHTILVPTMLPVHFKLMLKILENAGYKVALLENKGNVVSRERLMEKLWQTDSFVDENTLSVNVGRLRKKLDAAGLNDFIETKFGVGYIIK